jgi:hypothetical protein
MALLKSILSLLIIAAAIHTLLSWILLFKVRRNVPVRNEIFGSIKTLILGPKAMRLKHLFTRSIPNVIDLQPPAIRNVFLWAKWSGWVTMFLLLVAIALQVRIFMVGVNV